MRNETGGLSVEIDEGNCVCVCMQASTKSAA